MACSFMVSLLQNSIYNVNQPVYSAVNSYDTLYIAYQRVLEIILQKAHGNNLKFF